MNIIHRPLLFLLPLLLATANADFPYFSNPWFQDNNNLPDLPDLPDLPNNNDDPLSFDLNNFVPNLFAPTPDQKPFEPQPVSDDDPADNAGGGDDGGESTGSWEIFSKNSGVSAMHLQITPRNKAIMFDTFVYGPSQIALPPDNCRKVPNRTDDCWAHGVEFDVKTADTRPLKMLTDPWCSSGGLSVDGTLVNAGGWFDGVRSVRYLGPTGDFIEYPNTLAPPGRWYATQQILPDGGFVVIGGRRAFSYEYIPAPGKNSPTVFELPFLVETTEKDENNLYPFVHLLPDGNLFVFANTRSILLNPVTGKVVTEYPVLGGGGARNYPPSGMSALLPLDLRGNDIVAEVLVCGGGSPIGMDLAANGTFLPALKSCGRITANKPQPTWEMEDMPLARTMGDMLLLPNGEVLMINGAARGVAGWWFARDPVLAPVLYTPTAPAGQRFRTLARTTIPRVYHSSSAVLPDASVMVAGSNPNSAYNFTDVLFPTELRVEKFRPPYLDDSKADLRPTIDRNSIKGPLKYGGSMKLEFQLQGTATAMKNIMVTMYYPPFTTHGFSQNQRLLILKTQTLDFNDADNSFVMTVATPPSAVLAPPGHYLVFVVNEGVPSEGVWVKIQ